MSDLMRHREREDQVAPELPVSASPSRTSCSGSLSCSLSTGLEAAALPASLQAWLIPRSAVEYQTRQDGQLAVLGEGARWAAVFVAVQTPACKAGVRHGLL